LVPNNNAAIARQWFEQFWNQKKFDTIEQLVSPDCRLHGHADNDEVVGMAEFQQFAQALQKAFPDIQIEVEDTISEGDRTVARWVSRGTHQGEFMGIPPTGKKIFVRGVSVVRFSDGKMVESWDSWDKFGMLQSLGALPETSAPPRAKAS
jgi:steroid delta-isomerase-like uncharacterized protein